MVAKLDGIERVAVIGSGVMGAGIAAHCANAGCEVMLLDIVPEGAEDRDSLAKGSIAKMLKSNPEMLMHKSYVKRWKKSCTKKNIAFHFTGTDGAFIIKNE